jgi:lysyl-tRNA synthetase class 2
VSGAPPRYPIEVVRRLSPGSSACVAGRIIDARVDTSPGERESARGQPPSGALPTQHARSDTAGACPAGAVLVHDVTGQVWIDCRPIPVVGAWVVAAGFWDGERLRHAAVTVVSVPYGSFPRSGGDFVWAQADGGRRLRLLRGRAAMLRSVRQFFDQRAFTEVETPLAVPSPGLDVHLDALAVDGLGTPRWLITSPEYQMKRLLAAGLPRIYQITKCFRKGEVGERHQPEFTMLEWYRAFSGMHEVMRDTEELVAHVARQVHGGSSVIPGIEQPVDVTPPWERLTLDDAFQRYAGVTVSQVIHDEERFFRLLGEQVEPRLGRGRPVFVTGWPARLASLARLDPADPTVAERFEAFVDGMELCNGFTELIDPVEQRQRFWRDQQERARLNKPVYPIDERFLGALEEAIPPSGGNALGLDRLVMLVLGASRIEDVVAFGQSRI